METTTNRLSSAKWSRNLNKDCQSEANRLRLLERQRQLIESKLQRRQQQEHQNANIISSTSNSPSTSTLTSRPATSIANLRSGRPRSSTTARSIDGSSIHDHDDLDNTIKESSIRSNDTNNRARTSVPGSRTIISSGLDGQIPGSKSSNQNQINNHSTNISKDNLGSLKPLTGGGGGGSSNANNVKNFRENRSMSKSELNLNVAVSRNDDSSINDQSLNRKLASPNPLTTVLSDEELLKFVSQPVSPDVTLQCTIIRDKKGLDRSLYPTYYMHLQDIVQNNLSSKSLDFGKINKNNDEKVEGTATVWMSDSLESINSNEDTDDGEIDELNMKNQSMDNNHQQQQMEKDRSNSVTSSSKKVFMLSGRRRKKSKTYLIGNNAFDISRDRCIAKLKSNVLGTQFTAIRLESNFIPDRDDIFFKLIVRLHQNGVRYEITSITYETNVLGFKGPRKMTIIIPKPDEKTNALCNLSLQEELKRNSRAIMLLKNKTPIWNEETQSYVLNFHGRVTQASVKNFQLVVQDSLNHNNNSKKSDQKDELAVRRSASSHHLNRNYFSDDEDDDDDDEDDDDENEENHSTKRTTRNNSNNPKLAQKQNLSRSGYLTASSSEDAKQIADTNELVSLQFGRVSNTHFSCDVSWPLSLLQAFAIALSSFDSKLACE